MISDKQFLGFEWPPKMASFRPKQKRQYTHNVTVLSSTNAEYAFTLSFTSEKKARAFKRDAEQSTNNPIVEYERKELPIVTDERFEES